MEINTEHCEFCDGQGFVPGHMKVESIGMVTTLKTSINPITDLKTKTYDYLLCPRCRGTGMIDWVRKITRSRSDEFPTTEEVTPAVRELIWENNIFQGDMVEMETSRRRILKQVEEDERRRGL